jgi:hypothetical protein
MSNQLNGTDRTTRASAVIVRLPGAEYQFRRFNGIGPDYDRGSVILLVVYLIGQTSQTLLWLSAVLWLLFIGYWSVAAGNAGKTRTSESVRSRQVHQLLMYGALVLAFIRGSGFEWPLVAQESVDNCGGICNSNEFRLFGGSCKKAPWSQLER